MRSLILPILVLMSVACAAPAPPPVDNGPISIEDARRKSWDDIDHRACNAMGGKVRQDGMMGLYRCVTPFADAGKICRDNSDCMGQCRTSDDVTDYNAAPGTQVGKCQVNDSPFGCYGTVERGTAGGMLCVD